MKKVKAQLLFELWVCCPFCKKSFDLIADDQDDDGIFTVPLFNNKWEDLSSATVVCSCCQSEFEVEKIEY